MRLKSFPERKKKVIFSINFPQIHNQKLVLLFFVIFAYSSVILQRIFSLRYIITYEKFPENSRRQPVVFEWKIDRFAAGSEFTEVSEWGGGTRRWSLLGSWFAIWPGGKGRGRKYHVALGGKRGGGKEMDYRPSKKCGMLYGLKIAG